MKTPARLWNEHRDMVYKSDGPLMESVEFEAKRSFFAGSEAMFKIMDSLSGLKTNHALRLLSEYREMNRY